MPQEMSFAQALNEARQIIVQQSNRIKTDLEKLKALHETVTIQTGSLAEGDRHLREKTAQLGDAQDRVNLISAQLKLATDQLEQMRTAREQGEAVINQQGQQISQLQDTVSGMERQLSEHAEKVEHTTRELEAVRAVVPTQEDNDALAALASLLSAKKGAPAAAPRPDAPAPTPEGVAAA